MPEDMISFDEAMQQLQFTEDELQKLVTSGALRAFRSGGEMKFRAGDLDAVKKERETEPTIIIPAAGGDDLADETVMAGVGDELQVEMPDDLIVDESAQTVVGAGEDEMGAPTVAIPEDQGTEELVFDDKELEVLPLEEEAAGTQAAEAATIVEDAGGDITVAEDDGEYEEEAADSRPPSSRRRVLSSRIGPAASRRKSAAFEVRRGNPIMSIVLVVSAAVALFALSVFGTILAKGYRVGVGTASEATYVPGFLRKFYDDESKEGWDLKRLGEGQ
jgi:hypothetical protein